MKKRIALMSDIHGNLDALETVLKDIKNEEIDEIICLGDTIGIGSKSKECIDLLIKNNIKSVIGKYELFILNENSLDSLLSKEEIENLNKIKKSLTDKEINYIKSCPLYYEINIDHDNSKFNKKYVLSHYLINNENDSYPFEKTDLKNDINLWKKYNSDSITYFIGHIHESFNINEVDGISCDLIEDDDVLTNIEIVDSVGCSKDNHACYTIIEISKTCSFTKRRIKYNKQC